MSAVLKKIKESQKGYSATNLSRASRVEEEIGERNPKSVKKEM